MRKPNDKLQSIMKWEGVYSGGKEKKACNSMTCQSENRTCLKMTHTWIPLPGNKIL